MLFDFQKGATETTCLYIPVPIMSKRLRVLLLSWCLNLVVNKLKNIASSFEINFMKYHKYL